MGIVHVVYSRSNVKVSTNRNYDLHLVKFEYMFLGEGQCFTHGEVERQNHLSKRVQLNIQGYLGDYKAHSRVLGR
jgi:hypothetical protein